MALGLATIGCTSGNAPYCYDGISRCADPPYDGGAGGRSFAICTEYWSASCVSGGAGLRERVVPQCGTGQPTCSEGAPRCVTIPCDGVLYHGSAYVPD